MILSDTCDKCKRRNPIAFRIDPKEAWDTVVLNRWRSLCPTCFDVEAELARIAYTFTDLGATSWSERPPPRNKYKRRR